MRRIMVSLLLWCLSLYGAVDLNHATAEELATLKGIGPSKAQAIVAYRTKNRGFRSTEELKAVRGIGPKLYEKIKDHITVRP